THNSVLLVKKGFFKSVFSACVKTSKIFNKLSENGCDKRYTRHDNSILWQLWDQGLGASFTTKSIKVAQLVFYRAC
ncbi:mCG145029, partial [Mus musculus]